MFVPVTKKESSGRPLDSKKYGQLMSLVEQGFAQGEFQKGRGEALSDKWETDLRALLHDTDVQVRTYPPQPTPGPTPTPPLLPFRPLLLPQDPPAVNHPHSICTS